MKEPGSANQWRSSIQEGLCGARIDQPEGRASIAQLYEHILLDDVLPFWFPSCVDEASGGFFSCLDQGGKVYETDKSVWAQGRMSWMLLRLYLDRDQNPEWLHWACHGIEFLDRHGFDSDGRMFFLLDRQGKALRKRRYAFSESFAAIAYALHAKATQNAASADRSMALLKHFMHWHLDPTSAFESKGTGVRPTVALGPYMIALVTAQELRDALGNEAFFNPIVDQMIESILKLFVHPELSCVLEEATPDGNVSPHLEGQTLNPGHAIEAAWFVIHEGAMRGETAWVDAGCHMLDWMFQRAWDPVHGGLLYYTSLNGLPVQEYWHDMKFWWPHNEALIATIYAYQQTREPRYAKMHEQVHHWAFSHFQDTQHGEWFGYLHRDGTVSNQVKGNLWKSAFHHPRALHIGASLLRKQATQA